MDDDALVDLARAVVRERPLSGSREARAGQVGAALVTASGAVHTGVCLDLPSGIGFCAEHAAVAAMVTSGESRVHEVVAVWLDESGTLFVLPPCGRCRELLRLVDSGNLDTEVVLGRGRRVPLRELLPQHAWPAPY